MKESVCVVEFAFDVSLLMEVSVSDCALEYCVLSDDVSLALAHVVISVYGKVESLRIVDFVEC